MKNGLCIALLWFLRSEPGEIYPDQVISFVESHNENREGDRILEEYVNNRNLENILNSFFQEKFMEPSSCVFVKKNQNTGAIYTVSKTRDKYDHLINDFDPHYCLNLFLHTTQAFFRFKIKNSIKVEKIPIERVIIIKKTDVEINFTGLSEGEPIFLNQFCLTEFLEKVKSYLEVKYADRVKQISIRRICFDKVCFCGITHLSLDTSDVMEICSNLEQISAEGTSFEEEVYVQNLIFYFKHRNDDLRFGKGINFRSARFFSAIYFRNMKFQGDTDTAVVSFEDAHFSQTMEVNNVVFGNVKLIFYQTILGDEKGSEEDKNKGNIFLRNLHFLEKSEIDFTGVETLAARIELVNIEYLPIVKMRFEYIDGKKRDLCSPDVFLLFKNCKICNPIYIKNISKLCFWKTFNFSQIVEEDDWKTIYNGEENLEKDRILKKQKIKSKLLMAVYNNDKDDYFDRKDNLKNILNFAKAKDFIMLKENFRVVGEYDREDHAFLLYMKYKPYIDAWNKEGSLDKVREKKLNKIMYGVLNFIGGYGTSPCRIFLAWFLFFVCSLVMDDNKENKNVIIDAVYQL